MSEDDEELEHKPLVWAFYIFMLVVVFFILSGYFKEAAADNLHKQKVLASNLALLHDSIVIEENAYSEYLIDENFHIKFDTTKNCLVYARHDKSKVDSSFSCKKTIYDSGNILEFNNSSKLIFNKTGDSFVILAE